ncbi:MAG: hypothetical protein GY855_06755 [candidate division Zixibacteria bacterium]|nr:hypothetical protein [candidate division Zixibacteria bacterium]
MREITLNILLIVILLFSFYGCDDRSSNPTFGKTVEITYPFPGSTVHDSITVKVTTREIQSVSRVDFFIDTDSIYSDTLPPYRYFWSTHNVTTGQNHTIYSRAITDDSTYISDTITVTVSLNSGFYLLSEFQTQGAVQSTQSDDDNKYLYTAVEGEGVDIYDISNPYSMEYVSSINTTGNAMAVVFWNHYLLISEEGAGMSIWNVFNPSTPVSIDNYDTPGNVVNLVFDPTDSIVYAADGNTMQIVKLDTSLHFQPLSSLVLGININDLDISGNYVHLGTADGIVIADVGDPSNPSTVTGGTYPSATPINCIATTGTRDYIAAGSGGITIISSANLSNLAFLASFDTPGDAQAIDYHTGSSPDVIYVADGTEGVISYYYSESSSPPLSYMSTYENQGFAYDVYHSNGLLFVADNTQVLILRFVQ